jgi:hypothetical protein
MGGGQRCLCRNHNQFLTEWTGLYFSDGSLHTCCVTAGHPLAKTSNINMVETRSCKVGLILAPRTFTS